MKIQRFIAYVLKTILTPFIFLPDTWRPIHLCKWYGKLGINVPPLVGKTVIPTVTTGTAGSITTSSAIISNNSISSTGGSNPSEIGVCYSTSNATPTTADTVSNQTGSFGAISFNQFLSPLPSGTVVYFRAYAINTAGTGYGTASSFTTTSAVSSVNSGFFQLM
jgi:hypothetical protein